MCFCVYGFVLICMLVCVCAFVLCMLVFVCVSVCVEELCARGFQSVILSHSTLLF